MKPELYTLANGLEPSDSAPYGYSSESPMHLDGTSKAKYQYRIQASIQRERKALRKKRLTAAAACFALITVFAFNSKVQATVTQSLGSIGAFLGIKNDSSKYTEIINTSVSNGGYKATLKEVVIAEEKVAVSYTLQRENGKPFPSYRSHYAALYVDGQEIYGGTGNSGFLDKEHTIQGSEFMYEMPGIDLTEEKTYELKIAAYSGGEWRFKFKASGAELAADTKHIELGDTFTLPNGASFTLQNLSLNAFEQKADYYLESPSDCLIRLSITDDQGRKAYFDQAHFGAHTDYLKNDNLTGDGSIAADAKAITIEVQYAKYNETEGQLSDWAAVGQLTLDLLNLK